MQPDSADIEAVKAANQRFYEAFGTLDIREMDEVWEASGRAMCVHPGWQPLVGWDSIRTSWAGIFDNTTLMHFNVHYVNVVVHGDSAWVTCVENISSVLQGRANISSVLQGRASNFGILSTNIFVRTPEGWKMSAHHAAPNM